MTPQLQAWQGDFGKSYTERNVVDWRTRLPAFRFMLSGLAVNRVLEIGCNRGHNLEALVDIYPDNSEIVGIEPNRYAASIARVVNPRFGVLIGNVFDIPFKDGYFDLVFTSGVLIHVSPEDLHSAIAEISRVTKRYILAIEYFAEEETVIHYRDHDDLLWKRDFLSAYLQHPRWALVRSGIWDVADGFDRSSWWLLEKQGNG